MASVRKDPERGTWTFVVDVESMDGRRRQVKRRGFATRRAALDAMDELRSAGPAVASERLRFGEYLTKRWLPAIEGQGTRRASTLSGYRQQVKRLEDHLGGVKLADLNGSHLETLYGELRSQGLSERTVRYVHTTAAAALKDAVRWKLVSRSVADDAVAPAQARPNPEAWTPDEVARFLRVARKDRWWPLWRVVASSGMRRGELCALRWSAIDLTEGVVTVERADVVVAGRVVEEPTKSGKPRRIVLDGGTVETLKAWKRSQAAERLAFPGPWVAGDRVWTWEDGSPLLPDVVSRTFARLRKKAKLPPLRLHNLRHAWATSALRAGVPLKVVSTRLGHSSVSITADIYTADVDELDGAAAELVADLYSRPPKTAAENLVTNL